jgi:hypothetical protein
MNSQKNWYIWILLIAAGIGSLALAFKSRLRLYPNGDRTAFMRVVASELMNYAARHDEWFPNGSDEYRALAKLWPGSPCGPELAGLSGSISQVTNALNTGQSLSNFRIWQYVPGYRSDDSPELAILWETEFGLWESGKKISQRTRAVLLVDYRITNILESDWPKFQTNQAKLIDILKAKGRNLSPR